MIKFAVSRPQDRKNAIDQGLRALEWANDPILKRYGLKIEPKMLQTKARLLDPPEVMYAPGQKATPGYTGRWDLRAKKFQVIGAKLIGWSVVILDAGSDYRA